MRRFRLLGLISVLALGAMCLRPVLLHRVGENRSGIVQKAKLSTLLNDF